ncbi:hypothetical protein N9X64_00045 [bacterium]|nr:hypothetical protein [bacterium]
MTTTRTITTEKKKLIEIMKDLIERVGGISAYNLYYEDPYSIEFAVEDFLPLLELLGIKVPELGLESD